MWLTRLSIAVKGLRERKSSSRTPAPDAGIEARALRWPRDAPRGPAARAARPPGATHVRDGLRGGALVELGHHQVVRRLVAWSQDQDRVWRRRGG